MQGPKNRIYCENPANLDADSEHAWPFTEVAARISGPGRPEMLPGPPSRKPKLALHGSGGVGSVAKPGFCFMR